MSQMELDRTRDVARSLVEVLAAYEEELIALEADTPAVAPLRRAIGMAIAEACYWISESPSPRVEPPRSWVN